MESIDAFVDELPKVELHVHLVGSASLSTVLTLARRHPDGQVPLSEPELALFYEFRDFPHFAEVYHAVSGLLREPADVAELAVGAARDLAGQNVRYVELTVTPYTFTARGMPAAELTEALDVAARAARREHGVQLAYIFDIAGELGAPAAYATLEHALRWRSEALTGFGLAELRDRQVPLEVCPTSNVCTRQVADLASHPLPRLLAAGLFVTLNSDDPPMFGTTLTTEYRRAASAFGLSRGQLAELAKNGVRASFLDAAAKQALIAEIDSVAS